MLFILFTRRRLFHLKEAAVIGHGAREAAKGLFQPQIDPSEESKGRRSLCVGPASAKEAIQGTSPYQFHLKNSTQKYNSSIKGDKG